MCHWLLKQLNMHIKCVFGHTKRVVLVCCEHVITFVPEIIWRVTYYICCSSHLLCTSNSHLSLPCLNIPSLSMNRLPQFANYYKWHITLTPTFLSTHYNGKMCSSRKYPDPNPPGFSIFPGNWWPPHPSGISTSVTKTPSPSGKVHFHKERLLK